MHNSGADLSKHPWKLQYGNRYLNISNSSGGPNRVNRAHWPTKENRQNFSIFPIFPAHAKNGPRWPQMGPGGFFPTNPDLADILGRTDLDFENLYFLDFFGSQISGLGPLGPSLGPPTWARRGPTHLGPAWAHPLGPRRRRRRRTNSQIPT